METPHSRPSTINMAPQLSVRDEKKSDSVDDDDNNRKPASAVVVTVAKAFASVAAVKGRATSRKNASDATVEDYQEGGKRIEGRPGDTNSSSLPRHQDQRIQQQHEEEPSFPLPPTASPTLTSSTQRLPHTRNKFSSQRDSQPERRPRQSTTTNNSRRRPRPSPPATTTTRKEDRSPFHRHHSSSSAHHHSQRQLDDYDDYGDNDRRNLQRSTSNHHRNNHQNNEDDDRMDQSGFAGDNDGVSPKQHHQQQQPSNSTPRNSSSRVRADDDDGYNNTQKGQEQQHQGGDTEHCLRDVEADDEQEQETLCWRSRLYVGRLVNNLYVQISIIILILINAITMGLGTMDWATDDPKVDLVFFKIDQAFLVIFSLEVSMQLYYLGISLFRDGWLVFDLAIVVLSWSFEGLQIVRAFRIFRAFRLVTRVKSLRDLVLAIGEVLPRMYAISILLMIIFYVFAVLFTELFSELELSDNYFRTLDASLFTCMEMMTLEWTEIAREVIEYKIWAWAPFVFFIAITGFIVFNLIVAVVVEAVAVTEHTVRALDGIEPNSPTAKLEEAEERIDLLRYHMKDMMRTQEQIQSMLEVMAGQMMNLETERVKAEGREKVLRTEIDRRIEYQPLERSFAIEREKRESLRHERRQLQQEISREKFQSMDGVSLYDMQKSMHSKRPSSPHSLSGRHIRSTSRRSAASREGGVKAEGREKVLRTEINRRSIEYQPLEGSFAMEREKRESLRHEHRQLQQEISQEMLKSMDGVSLYDIQKFMHSKRPSSPHSLSRRHTRSTSRRSATSREGGSGHGSNRSLGHGSNRSLSPRGGSTRNEKEASANESGRGEKGWKRFVALHSQDL